MIKDYIALDLETSGLNPSSDKIIEIGMIRVSEGAIVQKYSTLLNPQEKLPPRITELTGITDDMVCNQPVIADKIQEIVDFIGELPLLGHNIIFDYSFLKKACVNHHISFERMGIDTLKIARRLLPEVEHKNLDYLCAYFHINPGNSHRALDDAFSAHQLFWQMYQMKPEEEGFSVPIPLQYTVKKDAPITDAQKRYLRSLITYHGITIQEEIESITKSKASKMIDQIISEHGKIPYQNR